MFDVLIFVSVYLCLPWLVFSVIATAWRDIVSLCGDSPDDVQWGSYCSYNSNNSNDFINSINSNDSSETINPASGLPMVDGSVGVDVGGNVYGSNSRHW